MNFILNAVLIVIVGTAALTLLPIVIMSTVWILYTLGDMIKKLFKNWNITLLDAII